MSLKSSRYLHQLNHLSTKLPKDIDIHFEFATPFPDSSAFSVEENYALSDIHYEKCALLFNIAAFYSQKATQRSRTSTDGIKGALQDLQVGCLLVYKATHLIGLAIVGCF